MDALTLIQRLLEARESWVDLGDGLRVKVRRPAEAELHAYLKARSDVDTHLRCVVGWEGFSQATLLGPEVGSSDPIAFDADLWLHAARDRAEWLNAVAAGVAEAMEAHITARKAAAKNSKPSSTPPAAASGRAKKAR